MTVEFGGKRVIVVGVKFDSRDWELLSWAIVKVAEQGDEVIAVHVSRKPGHAGKDKLLLDEVLESYRDLCNIKKVNLVGRILKADCYWKSLVKEAKICHAVAIVVGRSTQATLGGWSSSTAKYCAKRLPTSVEVLGIHNGKVVSRTGSTNQTTGLGRDPRPSINMFLQLDSHASENSFEDKENHTNTCSSPLNGNMEHKPGWPLLRKTVLSSQKALEARKLSVVQWVMNLPNRSPPCTPERDSSVLCFSPLGGETGNSPDFETSDVFSSGFTWFSYEVLKNATSRFSSENLIGNGGCSRVYKGRFLDGKPVAVKVTRSTRETWKDFSLEIDIISSLKHENVAKLLGVCIENNRLISVYELMSKGSLEDNLHGNDEKENNVLTWEARFKVAVGIAKALDYLHGGSSRTVIHRDIKSSNILLSDEFEPKLSDFGLAIWGPSNSSFETYNDVVGTFGYLAPEYFMYGKVSDKVDVYSFGVVLLELLSGRKPIGSAKGQESLVMWAKPILESGKLEGILDPKLRAYVNRTQMQRMILAATLCLTTSARIRPHMTQILKLLRGEETIEKWTSSHNQTCYQEDVNDNDDEVYADAGRKSHLSLALLDVEDDFTSTSSMEQSSHFTLEDYLKGRWSRRWSRSSSFN